jgi:HEAT repeat protein
MSTSAFLGPPTTVPGGRRKEPVTRDARLLVASLEDPGALFRVQGEILARGRETVPALAAFLLGRPAVLFEARAAAADCLGILGGAEAVEALVAVLTHHDLQQLTPAVRMAERAVRNAAARALGRTGAREAIPALLAALGEQRLIGAGAALAAFGEPRAIPGLVDLLEEPTHAEAAQLLTAFGRAAVPALAATLGARWPDAEYEAPGSVQRRTLAAEVLGRLGGEAAVAALRAHLGDPSPRVQTACALALAAAHEADDRALHVLAAALGDEDFTVQADVLRVLEGVGDRARPMLAAVLADEHATLRARELACLLLGRSQHPGAVAVLAAAARAENPSVRQAALRALAMFPDDREALAALRAARRDPARPVRATARELLRRRGR